MLCSLRLDSSFSHHEPKFITPKAQPHVNVYALDRGFANLLQVSTQDTGQPSQQGVCSPVTGTGRTTVEGRTEDTRKDWHQGAGTRQATTKQNDSTAAITGVPVLDDGLLLSSDTTWGYRYTHNEREADEVEQSDPA